MGTPCSPRRMSIKGACILLRPKESCQAVMRDSWLHHHNTHASSVFGIAVRDEAKEVRPDARPQAWKNRRCIRWNTLRIISGRERRRWLQIVRRRRKVNVGQAPKPHAITQENGSCHGFRGLTLTLTGRGERM